MLVCGGETRENEVVKLIRTRIGVKITFVQFLSFFFTFGDQWVLITTTS